jgi:hypothetical protein
MTSTDVHEAAQPQAPTAPMGHRIVWSLAGAAARLAKWPLWVVNAAVFGVFAGVFFASSAPFAIPRVEAACGQAPPDVRFTSSAADVIGFLNVCGAVGRDAYRLLQVADLAYPAVFGMFMATSMALVISQLAPARRALLTLAVLPLIGSAFDYLENLCAWLALAAFPGPAPTSSLLGLASAAKNLTFWTSGALLLGALGMLVIAKARRPVRPSANRAGVDASGGSH